MGAETALCMEAAGRDLPRPVPLGQVERAEEKGLEVPLEPAVLQPCGQHRGPGRAVPVPPRLGCSHAEHCLGKEAGARC